MFFTAHLVAGLLVGELFGNYLPALLGSLLLDFDHLVAYFRHGVIFSWKDFWSHVTSPEDPYGERTFLHSFTCWLPLSLLIIVFSPDFGIVFAVGYLSHLLMDLVDDSDFYPFWPFELTVHGPVGYFSITELVITVFLFLAWILV